jgi:hypothetical protein
VKEFGSRIRKNSVRATSSVLKSHDFSYVCGSRIRKNSVRATSSVLKSHDFSYVCGSRIRKNSDRATSSVLKSHDFSYVCGSRIRKNSDRATSSVLKSHDFSYVNLRTRKSFTALPSGTDSNSLTLANELTRIVVQKPDDHRDKLGGVVNT